MNAPVHPAASGLAALARDLFGWRSLLATAVVLVAFEGSFRLAGLDGYYPTPWVERVIPGPEGITQRSSYGYMPHATVEVIYGSNPRGYFDGDNGIRHQHNSVGWRGREIAVDKPAGTFRVLALGDSYTWGQGVREDDLALNRIGRGLNEDPMLRPVETVNTALPSMNTWWQLASLDGAGLAYDPDLVILFFVVNDVEARATEATPAVEVLHAYTSAVLTRDRLSHYSHMWSFFRQRYLARVSGRSYIDDSLAGFGATSEAWLSCSAALTRMRDLLTERGVPFLLVVYPILYQLDGAYPFQPIHDIVGAYARDMGIPVLDLKEAYRGYSGPELWVDATDHHPNEEAHGISAEATLAWLRAHPELLQKR